MDFNEWCNKRDYLLRVSGYNGDTEKYFERLKNKVDSLGLNAGLKNVYVKRNGPNEVERFYFFYEEKMSVVYLNSMEFIVDDFHYPNLERIKYKFILNSDYKDALTLKFKNKTFTLDPIQDTEPSQYQNYNTLIKEIYFLVK